MRILRTIEMEGRRLTALFDTDSARSYIASEHRPDSTRTVTPISVVIGGRRRLLDERCNFAAGIDGLEFDMTAYVVDGLDDGEFGKIDVLIGALTMTEWWIKPDADGNGLDLSALRRRRFTEFAAW